MADSKKGSTASAQLGGTTGVDQAVDFAGPYQAARLNLIPNRTLPEM
jgi:hypothetical protein